MRTDLPAIDDTTARFWAGCADGRLLVNHCGACGTTFTYPRPFCPSCWSEAVEWVEVSGRARLYTWSTVHLNPLPPFDAQVPYVAAIVDLEEGPRLMTRLVDADPEVLAIDMALEVTFVELDPGVTAPCFRPASAA